MSRGDTAASVQTAQSSCPGGSFWQGCPSRPLPLQLHRTGAVLSPKHPLAEAWGRRKPTGPFPTLGAVQ